MNRKIVFGRSIKDILVAFGPTLAVLAIIVIVGYIYIDPAPPKHLVISTGDDEGDYTQYANLYKDILKEDGVELEIRPSSGAFENLKKLQDKKSGVQVGFVQDGLGTGDDYPDLMSLGSLYYEPIWIFYRGKQDLTRLSQFTGKKIAIGRPGGGMRVLALRLLDAAGVNAKDATFVDVGTDAAAAELMKGSIDAAMFVRTPDDPLITKLFEDRSLKLMSMDQAEAIARKNPFLHHLVLPHGAIDLHRGIPEKDVDLVSPTATLVVRDDLHSALIDLLLKAASQVHGEPGIFEKKNEFPAAKDDEIPLSTEAKRFYKNGTPFWQRYLPFWLATLVDRFIIFVIPAMAVIIPLLRAVPRIMDWRMKSRFYRNYGELKFLEAQMRGADHSKYDEYLKELDQIEERVNHMKVPLGFSDHIYVLREHIELVRSKLTRVLSSRQHDRRSRPNV